MHRLVSGCRELADFAHERGIMLAFEPEPGMFIDTMDKFAELHSRVDHPSFGLTLDIGHLHCMGEVPVSDHIKKWKGLLRNIHIEDMKHGQHEHLMFAEGEIDFQPVAEALKKINYEGGVYVELSRHSHNAVETAKDAMEFLRGQSFG
jgi:sugar phosphate isomerase/epimerase